MIIKSEYDMRDYLLLTKGGFRLFESSRNKQKQKLSRNKLQKLDITPDGKSNTENSNEKLKILTNYPKIKEYRKNLFLKNIVSNEKSYILEDYMKYKELQLAKKRNIKTYYDARKTFFSNDKINDNRNSYLYQEKNFDDKNKYPLVIKDIQSNYILLKNQRLKKYKEYYLRKKLEEEEKNFKDVNEKLGVRNVYIKSDKISSSIKNMTFINKNLNFYSCVNFMKKFYKTQKGIFGKKRKYFSVKI